MAWVYRFIFYLFYKFFIRVSKKDIPERKAIVVLTLWDFFYLLIPYSIVTFVLNKKWLFSKLFIGVLIVLIALIHFFSLIYSKKYLRVYKEFEKQTELRAKYGALIIVSYLLIPILFFIIFTFTIWR